MDQGHSYTIEHPGWSTGLDRRISGAAHAHLGGYIGFCIRSNHRTRPVGRVCQNSVPVGALSQRFLSSRTARFTSTGSPWLNGLTVTVNSGPSRGLELHTINGGARDIFVRVQAVLAERGVTQIAVQEGRVTNKVINANEYAIMLDNVETGTVLRRQTVPVLTPVLIP